VLKCRQVKILPVKLRVLGVVKKEDLSWKQDMTVAEALEAVKVELPKEATITVNGKSAKSNTKVKENDLIVVTPNIRNG